MPHTHTHTIPTSKRQLFAHVCGERFLQVRFSMAVACQRCVAQHTTTTTMTSSTRCALFGIGCKGNAAERGTGTGGFSFCSCAANIKARTLCQCLCVVRFFLLLLALTQPNTQRKEPFLCASCMCVCVLCVCRVRDALNGFALKTYTHVRNETMRKCRSLPNGQVPPPPPL